MTDVAGLLSCTERDIGWLKAKAMSVAFATAHVVAHYSTIQSQTSQSFMHNTVLTSRYFDKRVLDLYLYIRPETGQTQSVREAG